MYVRAGDTGLIKRYDAAGNFPDSFDPAALGGYGTPCQGCLVVSNYSQPYPVPEPATLGLLGLGGLLMLLRRR